MASDFFFLEWSSFLQVYQSIGRHNVENNNTATATTTTMSNHCEWNRSMHGVDQILWIKKKYCSFHLYELVLVCPLSIKRNNVYFMLKTMWLLQLRTPWDYHVLQIDDAKKMAATQCYWHMWSGNLFPCYHSLSLFLSISLIWCTIICIASPFSFSLLNRMIQYSFPFPWPLPLDIEKWLYAKRIPFNDLLFFFQEKISMMIGQW